MRVTHLHSGNLYGGVETFLTTWMKASREVTPDWRHEFVLAWEGAFSANLRALGIPYSLVPAPRFSRPWSVMAARRAASTFIAQSKPDLVVAHGLWQASALLPIKNSVPTVLWMNDVLTPDHWLAWLARERHFSLVVAPSQFVSQRCEGYLNADRFETMLPAVAKPIAPTDRSAKRAELGVGPNEKVILQVGRMQPVKGHRALIRTVAQLRTNRPWKLWLVGGAQNEDEARYEASLKKQVAENELGSHVVFWGRQEEPASFFAAADIYCQLNERPEAFGIVFIEALRAGLPVLTHKLGGEAEIFSKMPGFLTDPDEPLSSLLILEQLIDDEAFWQSSKDEIARGDLSLCDPEIQSQKLARLLAGLVG